MRWFLAVLLMLVCGCDKSSGREKKSAFPFDQLPKVVLQAAKTKKPEVNFDNAFKTATGIYEVRGKTQNGKVVEVEVSESGEVLAVE